MDRFTSLLVELLANQVAQGPGSEASTRRALGALAPHPLSPHVADLGCGRGASALTLAQALGGTVLAIDALQAMVEATRIRAAEAGCRHVVEARVGDMLAPPVAPASLDLVWCESAVYAVGAEVALEAWVPLLRPGGGIGFSELCWRRDDPPDGARRFWSAEGVEPWDPAALETVVETAGVEIVEAFWLPASDWASYYEPIAAALPTFLARHPGDAEASAVAEAMEVELTAWRTWGDTFGYRFLVGRVG